MQIKKCIDARGKSLNAKEVVRTALQLICHIPDETFRRLTLHTFQADTHEVVQEAAAEVADALDSGHEGKAEKSY